MPAIKLKPCPFCGEQAVIVSHPGCNWDGKMGGCVNIGANHGNWYVGCPSPFFDGNCEVHPSASWYAHLKDAIRDWNKRTPECNP